MSDEQDDGGTASPLRAAIGEDVRKRLGRNPMVHRIDESPKLEIYGRQHFLSAEECAGLRALIDADAKPSTLFSGSASADYRTSHSCNLNPWDELVLAVSDRICALTGLPARHGKHCRGNAMRRGRNIRSIATISRSPPAIGRRCAPAAGSAAGPR
jgi:prolyl 4-hydroxylase